MKRGPFNRTSFRLWLMPILLGLGMAGAASAQIKPLPADPTFKLQALDDKVIDLANERGNVLLVSFGATWCTPCTTELKALQELLGEYKGQPVKFFWVSVESPADVTNSDLKRYARERSVTFPVLRDTGQMVYLQFSQRVRLPLIILLRKDGRIDAPLQFGMLNPVTTYKEHLRARLNKLLATSIDASQ
jgi:peroxiredoxin